MVDKKAFNKVIRDKRVDIICKQMFKVTLTFSQIKIVRCIAFAEHRRVVINCLTRYGKSFCTAMGMLLYVLLHTNKKNVIIAPTNKQCRIIMDYIAGFISSNSVLANAVDMDVVGISRLKKEVSKERITFKNGCEIRILSAEGKGERLMGHGVSGILILDESCLVSHETYRSKISRMLGDTYETTLVELGNPWHKNNQFYEHFLDNNFHKIHIDYRIALKEGRINHVYLEEQRKELSPLEFDVLYKAIFPEESESALFKHDHIKNAMRRMFKVLDGKFVIGLE